MDSTCNVVSEYICSGPWLQRRKHTCVVWRNKLHILGGFDTVHAKNFNDVWRLDDNEWSCLCPDASWPGRDGHCAVIFKDACFVLGGTDDPYFCRSDVWRSENGMNWTKVCYSALWPPRWQHASVVHRDNLYVLGGWGDAFLNDVWTSNDGDDWTLCCPSASWKARMFHTAVSFNDTLYIIGGSNGTTLFRDIWASSDGFVWTQVCEVAPWEGRQGHAVTVLDGTLYLCGGYNGKEQLSDIWATIDCVKWYLITNSASFSPRQGHTLSAFEGSLYVIGGYSDGECLNDTIKLSIVCSQSSAPSLQRRIPMTEVVSRFQALQEAQHRYTHVRSSFEAVVERVLVTIRCDVKCHSEDLPKPFDENSTDSPQTLLKTTRGEPRSLRSFSVPSSKSSDHHLSILDSSLTENIPTDGPQLRGPTQSDTRNSMSGMCDVPIMSCSSSENTPSVHDGSGGTVSSAALYESMRANKARIHSIQKSIRERAAQKDCSSDEISLLVAQRKELAVSAYEDARQLQTHVDHVHSLKESHKNELTHTLEYIESVFNSINSENCCSTEYGCRENLLLDSTRSQFTWEEWSEWIEECSEQMTLRKSPPSLLAVDELRSEMQAQAALSLELSTAMGSGHLQTPSSPSGDDLCLLKTRLLDLEKPHNLVDIGLKYEDVETRALDLRREVVKSIEEELVALESVTNISSSLLRSTCQKGYGIVSSVHNHINSDEMDVVDLRNEVNEWIELLEQWSERKASLSSRCDAMMEENTKNEELLVELENSRIDAKSNLEKLAIKAQRRNPRAKTVGDASCEEATMKEQLYKAEKSVRDFRREMRSWYRNLRSFAQTVAPELFFYLPDLLWAGSLLGDGGFAKYGNLVHRTLNEYDDVKPLFGVEEIARSRHVLLRATFDDRDVVLKGFRMTDEIQRSGLEREISILGSIKSEFLVTPLAIVDDVDRDVTDFVELCPKSTREYNMYRATVFIEYPYFAGGNLKSWVTNEARKPWELQSVARQLLYGVMCLHDHHIVHKDIKPSNILMHPDGRAVISDFDLARRMSEDDDIDIEQMTPFTPDARGFVAPEVESGKPAVFASDMYSVGVVLFFLHFPNELNRVIPGNTVIPSSCDAELANLIQSLLDIDSSKRPTAAHALNHPYIRSTFVDQMVLEGEVVDQNRKLHAVRDLFKRVRSENRTNLERITIRREHVVDDMLRVFQSIPLGRMRALLRVTFEGEAGVDEGGMLQELFSIFFEAILTDGGSIFEGSASVQREISGTINGSPSEVRVSNTYFLPAASKSIGAERLEIYNIFGRLLIKSLYEGCRIGSKLCPSVFKYITGTPPTIRDLQMFDPTMARSLQWALATGNVNDFGLHFESVGAPELGPVTDKNKSLFVKKSIEKILIIDREIGLQAIKDGFSEGLNALSVEGAPFMTLLSHLDWRVLICGDSKINSASVVAAFRFSGFRRKSKVPQWLNEIVMAFSEDMLRKFMVFVTGSASLPSSSSTGDEFTINVRGQRSSSALPIAHTCFFHLDIPDYPDKDTLQRKLIYAFQNACTFEIV